MASTPAIIEDGKIVDSVASSSSKANKSSSSLGKDDFLQLLVAQMKYQDPMEPTSNTEYIQQYATYSELEQMMNMSETMDLQRASAYVGQSVRIDYTSSTGENLVVEGVVDYVYYESGTPYVSVNGELYKAEDVTSVYDATYIEATELANAWLKAFKSLPALDDVTLSDYESVETLYKALSQFSDYTKGFLGQEVQDTFQKYVDKVVELKKNDTSSGTDNKTETDSKADTDNKTEADSSEKSESGTEVS